MSRRGAGKPPQLPDFHLWHDVAQTVLPLRPRRVHRPTSALPVPPAAAPQPKPPKLPRVIAMPSYQSPGTPGPQATGVIEPRLRQKLGRGRVPIDGTLDLHGMRQDEAYAALARFVRARAARGDRTILVITGKGLKKVNGDPTAIVERGVLRTMLPYWLAAPDIAPFVSGWDQSAQGHGGEGAWYVRLRRQPA